jgi:hypothetical protein
MKRVPDDDDFDNLIEQLMSTKKPKSLDTFGAEAQARLKELDDVAVPYPEECISKEAIEEHRSGLIAAIKSLIMDHRKTRIQIHDKNFNLIPKALDCTFWDNAFTWSNKVKSETKDDEKRYRSYIDRIIVVIEILWESEHPSVKCTIEENGILRLSIAKNEEGLR